VDDNFIYQNLMLALLACLDNGVELIVIGGLLENHVRYHLNVVGH
jgi:hypothetical protein